MASRNRHAGLATHRAAWSALRDHAQQIGGLHLRTLFAADPGRARRLTAEGAGLYLDYSKNRVTDETLGLLLQLAEQCDLRGQTMRCLPA